MKFYNALYHIGNVVEWIDYDTAMFTVWLDDGRFININNAKSGQLECLKGSVYEELPDKYFDSAIDAIIKELIENDYIICGDTHQRMALPVFAGCRYLMLSQRKWAEIMADAMNLKNKTKEYTYLDFYLASCCPIEEKLSNKK